MTKFEDFNISKQLLNALNDIEFDTPTPIQEKSYSVILSGKDMMGIAQTGTGKTYAYLLPLLRDLKFSKENKPRILIIVPTRELVLQVVKQTELLTKYMTVRTLGVFGGVNMNNHKRQALEGCDILVATPGRLYDLVICNAIQLDAVRKLVIDEVDVMLDLGFRFQLNNIFSLLKKTQNIMFSATMTEDIEAMIDDNFTSPVKISIAVSGTPLENIQQQAYNVKNFYTKANLLSHLLYNEEEFSKVLVFLSSKRNADRLYERMEEEFGSEMAIIHSNKAQNYRLRSIKQFNEGEKRILIATDLMARGLDMEKVSHVINFDTPAFPENYMHRIGRTGRAKEKGKSILFFTNKEDEAKRAIEKLMNYQIPMLEFPEEVERSKELTPEERPKEKEINTGGRTKDSTEEKGAAFHEKKEKNKKINQGNSYKRKLKAKYKKPKTRGDKNKNRRK